jgi:type IV pilus assembly protein PilA
MNRLRGNMTAQKLRTSRQDEGFTLIELLIVMSIILILVTLAIPQYTKVKKQTNETSAVASMKAIGTAETQFNSTYPQAGYSCTLPALGGDPKSGAPSAASAQVLDPNLAATGVKSGYQFSITNCTKQTVGNQDMYTGYQINGVPITVNKTGDRGFCMDENGLIKFDAAGGTNCTQSLQ